MRNSWAINGLKAYGNHNGATGLLIYQMATNGAEIDVSVCALVFLPGYSRYNTATNYYNA